MTTDSFLGNMKSNDVPFKHYECFGTSVPSNIANELKELSLAATGNTNPKTSFSGTRADYGANRRFLKNTDKDLSVSIQHFITTLASRAFKEFLAERFDINFSGSKLRAELADDVDGFFQVPHLDVKQKLITWLTYLGSSSQVGDVGTDLFDEDKKLVKSSQFEFNNGLIFMPSDNTWHGFSKGKKIIGNRRVLILNYVTDDWRDNHELAE